MMIDDYVKLIEGEVLCDIGRAADMAWLSIGDTIKVKNYQGREVLRGTYAIHIQCPWRMVDMNNNCILFASYDMYVPSSKNEQNEDFDWDIQGANRYDEEAGHWIRNNKGVRIKSVSVNRLGDLRMELTNTHLIEIFIDKSTDEECWRFFECNTEKPHLVFQGDGVVKCL